MDNGHRGLHACQLSVFWTESPSFSSHRNLRPRRLKSPYFEHRRKSRCAGHHDPHLEAYRAFGFRAEWSKVDTVFSI